MIGMIYFLLEPDMAQMCASCFSAGRLAPQKEPGFSVLSPM